MNCARKFVSVFIAGLVCLAVLSACAAPSAPAGGAVNPLFSYWPSHVGASVQFDRATRISGGVPGQADQVVKSLVTYKMIRLTPAGLTLAVSADSTVGDLIIPATLDPASPGFPKFVKTEAVDLDGKTYSCKVYGYQTTSSAEVGLDTQGLPADVTVWVSPAVPGGVVRRQISLTIKASYDIEDTLVSSPAPAGAGNP